MSNSIMTPNGTLRLNADIQITPRFKRYFPWKFASVFPETYQNTMRGLSGRERDVFDVIMVHIGSQNICRVERKKIADVLGITPNSVSKAISALSRHGVIFKHHDGVFEIDPEIMWMGKTEAYFEEPKNPTRATHRFVDITVKGEVFVTMHYPIIRTNAQMNRQKKK